MPNQNNQSEKKEGRSKFLKSVLNATSNHWTFNDGQVNAAMKVVGLGLLALLCVFVFVKTINEVKIYATIGQVPQSPDVITVSGKAEVKAIRDISTLTFTSRGKGKTASEAQGIAAEQNNKALAYLKSVGIAEKDISTLSYDTYPNYDQKVRPCVIEDVTGAKVSSAPSMEIEPVIAPVIPCNNYEQVISGYETLHSVQIKIRNIQANPALAGDVLTGLAATGVQVSNLMNTIDDEDALKSQARQLAIADARAEAEQIARSLGVRLGKIKSFYDESAGYPPMYEGAVMSADYMKAMASPEIPTGEAKIEAKVSLTFELRD